TRGRDKQDRKHTGAPRGSVLYPINQLFGTRTRLDLARGTPHTFQVLAHGLWSVMTAPSSIVESEIAREQEYVDRVYEAVEAMAESARAIAAEGHARARIDDADGVKRDHYHRFVERDALVNHAQQRLARINAEHSGLVFGRIDRTTGETDYIGRL